MNQEPKRPETEAPSEPEVQEGGGRSRRRDDQLKRVIKRHQQRDEPRVDSVEQDETPPP